MISWVKTLIKEEFTSLFTVQVYIYNKFKILIDFCIKANEITHCYSGIKRRAKH